MLTFSIFTIIVLVAVALLFVVGSAYAWLYSTRSDSDETKSKLRTLVAIAVTVVWITAIAAGILVTGYTVSPLLHAIMGGVVGYFFTDKGIHLNLGGDK